MEACHLLLGRPWQSVTFTPKECKTTLAPLSPREVCEDQNKLREKREQDKKRIERERK